MLLSIALITLAVNSVPNLWQSCRPCARGRCVASRYMQSACSNFYGSRLKTQDTREYVYRVTVHSTSTCTLLSTAPSIVLARYSSSIGLQTPPTVHAVADRQSGSATSIMR